MRIRDIKTACNDVLVQAFPQYPVYGNDTRDGYQRPSFFTELIPRTYRRTSKRAVNAAYTYKATFLETTHDESVCLGIVDQITDAFEFLIKVGKEHLVVEEIDYDWIDTNHDVLQVTIDFQPFTVITPPDLSGVPLMEVLDMDLYLWSGNYELKKLIDLFKLGRVHFYFDPKGHLRLRTSDDIVHRISFWIAGDDGHFVAKLSPLMQSLVSLTIDESGHIIATVYSDTDRIVEKFNVYVEERN